MFKYRIENNLFILLTVIIVITYSASVYFLYKGVTSESPVGIDIASTIYHTLPGIEIRLSHNASANEILSVYKSIYILDRDFLGLENPDFKCVLDLLNRYNIKKDDIYIDNISDFSIVDFFLIDDFTVDSLIRSQ